MTRPISRILALTICLLMGIFAAQAFANDYNHINSWARKIHSKAQVLLKETRHYRSTPNYVHMVSSVAELDQLACHLRDIAKHEGDLDHLASDIAEIDAKFHHVEHLFDATELSASKYGRGFIKGHTAHVKRLLESIEESIHHIGDDIEQLRAATQIVLKPALVANPNHRYGTSQIVNRAEAFRVPSVPARSIYSNRSVYRAPYGGSSYGGSSYGGSPYGNHLERVQHGLHAHDAHARHATETRYGHNRAHHQGSGFSIGSGSSRITFRF